MKKLENYCSIIFLFLLATTQVKAQSVDVVIRENGTERKESIDLPKSMTYPLDSLLNDWKAKNYIDLGKDCSTAEVNPLFSDSVYIDRLSRIPAVMEMPYNDMIPFGNMDQWIDRQIKESGIIGGATKNVYAIGPTATIRENKPYKNMGGSPWATSNVMARVAGITKTNTSVFPEKRGDGFCARMDTRMESVKVFGIVDITVLAAGSIFLGDVHEPIKGTKNPQKILNSGIPFTKKPIAIQFDYKVKMSDREKRVHATGFSKITDVEGKDFPEMNLFLQKRWEDKDGNIYAKRVGTVVVRYYTTTDDWRNNATYSIMYGDITGNPEYKAHMMRLQVQERYAVNSKGESVPIKEVAWGTEDDIPTHIQLQFTSSHGGAYIGSPGNSFYVDNVKLVY